MVAQGEYVYLRDGRPTGTVEAWELTRLPDGGRIYRAEVGDGAGLWHLMLAPDGRPDRLQARLRDEVGRRFDATFTFFDDEVMVAAGQVGKRPLKDFVELPSGFGLVWLPFAGREPALTGCGPEVIGLQPAVLYWMRRRSPKDGWLRAEAVECTVERAGRGMLEVPAGSFEAEEIVFAGPGMAGQRAWFGRHGTVLQWQSDGQPQTLLSRYWRFDDE
jgi:hypothetical protein